ncbi:MAG: c-type cytochrome biogenesis protein CcmI [Pseudomonadota bacterium]
MTFWLIISGVALLVALMLGRALIRPSAEGVPDAADYDLKVYRDQLAEVERDVARGIIAAADAERVRTEVSRRILQADAQQRDGVSAQTAPDKWPFALLAVLLVAGSLGLYTLIGQPGYGDLALDDRIARAELLRENRPDQATAVASLPARTEPADIDRAFVELMDRLRETVAARPTDLEGHALLAQNEARLGNYGAAAAAQETVLRIKGDAATANDIADYGELLVLSAGIYVSPEAEMAFRTALTRDETDGRSRYYLGLMMLQTGRPDIAFRLWDELLRRGPESAPWIAPILEQIDEIAYLAGVNYSIPTIGPGLAPGPSVADIEAAAEMSPEERMAMIGGMVDGLSNRLATEGGPPSDWARLITSLAILGNAPQARAVYENAVEVFTDSAAAMDVIRRAGQDAGVAE